MLNDNITERTYVSTIDGSVEPTVGSNNTNIITSGSYGKTLGVPAPAASSITPTLGVGFTAEQQDAAKLSVPVALANAVRNSLSITYFGDPPATLNVVTTTTGPQWVDPNDATAMSRYTSALPTGRGKFFFLLPITTGGGVITVDAPYSGYAWVLNPALGGVKITAIGSAPVLLANRNKEFWAIPYQYQAVGYSISLTTLLAEIEKIPYPLTGVASQGDAHWINSRAANNSKTLQLANTLVSRYLIADGVYPHLWSVARPTSAPVSTVAGTITYSASKDLTSALDVFKKFQSSLVYTFVTTAEADAASLATGLTVKELNAAKVTNASRGQADLLVAASAVTAVFDATNANIVNIITGQTFWAEGFMPLLPPVGQPKRYTTYYVTTLVTSWGEESAPSAPVGPFDIDLTYDSVTIPRPTELASGPTVAQYGLVGWRLYRANTGTTGTAFQLVTPTNRLSNPIETNGAFDYLTATTFADAKRWTQLAEVLPSTDWLPPPKIVKGATTYYLAGITQVTNGVMAGFIDNNLYFCEPYQPYAWPEAYRLTTKERVIGIANFGQTLAVLTAGAPYLCGGSDSASMSLQELPSPQSCASARSIVATENGVLYASPDGLCMVDLGGVSIITEGLFTRDDWQRLTPSSIFAEYHDGVYFFKFSGTAPDGTSGFCYAIDFAAKKLTRLDLSCTCLYNDPITDTLYAANGTSISALFSHASNKRTGVYRTGVIKLEAQTGFAWLQIDSDFTSSVVLQWFGDGSLVYTATVTSIAPVRLPAGRYLEHQLVLTTASRVTSVTMASSTQELKAA
jgi:hypothetical protein